MQTTEETTFEIVETRDGAIVGRPLMTGMTAREARSIASRLGQGFMAREQRSTAR
jgi:hypothetical protein